MGKEKDKHGPGIEAEVGERSLADVIWEQILEVLEEKLQYGLITQARSVRKVELCSLDSGGEELVLSIDDEPALRFFEQGINQQRLIFASKEIKQRNHQLEKIRLVWL